MCWIWGPLSCSGSFLKKEGPIYKLPKSLSSSERRFCLPGFSGLNLAPLLNNSETSRPQFLHLHERDNISTSLTGLLWEINVLCRWSCKGLHTRSLGTWCYFSFKLIHEGSRGPGGKDLVLISGTETGQGLDPGKTGALEQSFNLSKGNQESSSWGWTRSNQRGSSVTTAGRFQTVQVHSIFWCARCCCKCFSNIISLTSHNTPVWEREILSLLPFYRWEEMRHRIRFFSI